MQTSDSIVIIPTYNERENIENIIRAVFGLPKVFHILVIEDEEAINDLICMNLEVTGYQVTSFFGGEEVSKSLPENHTYACALVDVMLPGKEDS